MTRGSEPPRHFSTPESDPGSWIDVSDLGPDERRTVRAVVERMRLGFTRYGVLDIASNPKDWKREASEEFLDGAIYLAMQTIRERG